MSPNPGATPAPRLGLLGGSFNPPHLAHLALARLAVAELGLQELRWLPAGQPWQKPATSLAPAQHRLAMVKLLAAAEPRFVVDERELHRSGPSYTWDTVQELAREHPQTELWLVIGQDQYTRLPTWHAWRELLARVNLAVAARAGEAVAAPPQLKNHPHRLQVLPLPAMAHAATDIRRALFRQEDVTPMVGPQVAGYIAQHHLYPRSGPA